MVKTIMSTNQYQTLNKGFERTFKPNRLSIGLVVPIEHYPTSDIPNMDHDIERIVMAEELGFSAVWLRDIIFRVPSFGDAGQLYDPMVYLGYLAAKTSRITLGVASVILPLRHPAHVAKMAASVDALSGGRLVLGVASGDRPQEYPAMNIPFEARGERFRQGFEYIRQMQQPNPKINNSFGQVYGQPQMYPQTNGRVPLFITGSSRQSQDWIAQHGDGRMIYPQPPAQQQGVIQQWRAHLEANELDPKPVMQPLYVDLTNDPTPRPIHLGYACDTSFLIEHLKTLEAIGINHVALNLRFNRTDIEQTLKRLASDVLPAFDHQ